MKTGTLTVQQPSLQGVCPHLRACPATQQAIWALGLVSSLKQPAARRGLPPPRPPVCGTQSGSPCSTFPTSTGKAGCAVATADSRAGFKPRAGHRLSTPHLNGRSEVGGVSGWLRAGQQGGTPQEPPKRVYLGGSGHSPVSRHESQDKGARPAAGSGRAGRSGQPAGASGLSHHPTRVSPSPGVTNDRNSKPIVRSPGAVTAYPPGPGGVSCPRPGEGGATGPHAGPHGRATPALTGSQEPALGELGRQPPPPPPTQPLT